MKKRSNMESKPDPSTTKDAKKPKPEPTTTTTDSNFSRLDENLLFEVFKHADPKTLASASCVNKQWYRTALDERLWELICTRHWSTTINNSGSQQRRSVVLALGGFRLFYAQILSKTKASPPPPSMTPVITSTSSSSSSSSLVPPRGVVVRGGGSSKKDEINLTLSLLSIRYYYDQMNFANKRDS